MTLYGDARREYNRQWRTKRRQGWIDENGPCQKCGSTENLEVDHIDRKTKRISPTYLWSLSLTNPVRIEELLKCQVLCESCHQTKTTTEQSVPSKYTIEQITEVKRLILEGQVILRDIASKTNVNYGTVRNIKSKLITKHAPVYNQSVVL